MVWCRVRTVLLKDDYMTVFFDPTHEPLTSSQAVDRLHQAGHVVQSVSFDQGQWTIKTDKKAATAGTIQHAVAEILKGAAKKSQPTEKEEEILD